ncbi:hypothetical protein D3C80_2128600 [compost metagenome]
MTKINAPQLRSIQLVCIQIDVSGIAALRIILGIGRRPHQDDFISTVPIQIADAGIVGSVRIRLAVLRISISRFLQRN